MSTMSSSHSQAGVQKTEPSAYGEEGENPFALPSDELIFSFKETEKDRKIIEREKNKQLKIWEKNRPTREGCLRKICETDIEPTQLAINPKVQSKVNVAEAAGYTVPIERPKNKEFLIGPSFRERDSVEVDREKERNVLSSANAGDQKG